MNSLAQWSPSAFTIGGLLLAIDGAWLAVNIATGGENYLLTGQLFVGAGWTVALLGLLGIYPSLANRSRWLSRTGAIFTAIGVVTFAVMAIGVFVDLTGIVAGSFESISVYFIPGVLIGSVLGFAAFSVASLRSSVHSPTFGVLLLVPPVLVLSNLLRFIAGNTSEIVTLGIVIGDALSLVVIGYYLHNQSTTDPRPGAAQSTVEG